MSNPPVAELLARVLGELPSPEHRRSDLRVGIDVVDIRVLARQIASDIGPRFIASRFTASEIEDARGRVERFASRWAIKEAVAKAIGTGFREGLRPGSIEVVTEPSGAVSVQPSTGATWPGASSSWTWAVSASHESDTAVAIAIALTTQHEEEEGTCQKL